ncbi:GGDEF domain-containing protein [Alishewanella tabrizica]|uniref:diguanylate cyclase n=1 Tax=Alishewanella tabrizica TaxID=671278 RepID=A0ABQ2WIF9_9ALTE|nr:sensor domain-containing diguanylate cyclase [Alishewanella tabrizica]GGW55115.1 GGDEF domain-containing protein [Alishewanella tabrizica]
MSTLFNEQHTKHHQLAALIIASVLLVIALCLAPFLHVVLPEVKPFLPIYATCMVLLEGLTAYLLLSHFIANRLLYFGAVAAAYLFMLPLVIIQLMVFPGVFSPSGLLNAGTQSAVWIWVFWHGGFPAIILLTLLTERRGVQLQAAGNNLLWVWGFLLVPLALGLVFALFATWHSDLLPTLIDANNYQQLLHSPYAIIVWLVNILALLCLIRRSQVGGIMPVWLSLALFASLLDVTLTLLAGQRYSVGWYAARVSSTFSATIILGVLLWEMNRLYRDVQKDNVQLYQLTMLDALTGCFNRRYLDKRLSQELAIAARQQNCLALLILDVDYFKRFNDTYGHLAGDQCLQQVASVMRDTLQRPADFVARYGGEEFVIVLPDTDVTGAMQVAERIRQLVQQMSISIDNTAVHVTASLGVAVSDDGHILAADLIQQADLALYQAKAQGRNQVQLAIL